MRWVRFVGVWAFSLSLAACGGSSERSNPEPSPGGCDYDGKHYEDGATFPASDACNGCSCMNGEVACTLVECAADCEYDGKSYQTGDRFRASDGCNDCSCEGDGNVACTQRACPVDCQNVSAQYGTLMTAARACDPGQPNQCTKRVVEGLSCQCDTFVNPSGWDAAQADALSDEFRAGACGDGIACGPCNVPVQGRCSAQGQCVDEAEMVSLGVSCLVNGTLYPNGAGDISDPTSCNHCSCDNGHLACTEIGCSTPCPEGTTGGERCSQCGVAGGCAVIETGCLPSCADSSECESPESCFEGVCRLLCR